MSRAQDFDSSFHHHLFMFPLRSFAFSFSPNMGSVSAASLKLKLSQVVLDTPTRIDSPHLTLSSCRRVSIQR
ncbi:hypothetical protein V6Z11_A08G184500 [Gossypium hirsutum]